MRRRQLQIGVGARDRGRPTVGAVRAVRADALRRVAPGRCRDLA